jgi:hypothetical protein
VTELAASRREKDDDYGNIVTQLGATYRVIVCADAIQWIVQQKRGVWRSLCYCTSREGVIRRVKGLPGWEVLADLPERFPPTWTAPRPAQSAKLTPRAPSLPRALKTGSVRGAAASCAALAGLGQSKRDSGRSGTLEPSRLA